ncbi:Abi-alpha family protein [Sulfurimonas sp.]|uniref:Abi-alpha family protein n=1 Tax=Sulfurimonas sp. TaxID=2022749 RepID=UPI00356A0C89
MSEIEETAKATQEIAKVSGKAIDTLDKFGSFMSKYIGGSVEQACGIFEDKLKYMRWENQVNLMNKANLKLKELGQINPTKHIPLKLAIPLLESASLEDDSYLQDLWVNLLVNSSTNYDFSLERSYIIVLEQLTTLEAKILITIYSNKYKSNIQYDIQTHLLPDKINYIEQSMDFSKYKHTPNPIDPDDTIKLALSNLSRVRCINLIPTTGDENYSIIHPTLFGAKLYEAIN